MSWSAIDLFQDDDPLNLGRVGLYGDRAANLLLQKTDLILTLGTRLAIPQLGYDRADFARKASKWIVEIDPTECEKFSGLSWNVLNADVNDFLDQLTSSTNFNNVIKRSFSDWILEGETLWGKLPRLEQVGPMGTNNLEFLHSAEVIAVLNAELDENAIISC